MKKDNVDARTLRAVNDDLMALLRREDLSKLTMYDYHGFAKVRIPGEKLDPIAARHGADGQDIQAEIVGVMCDLSREGHVHKNAWAYCTVLGAKEHFEQVRGGYVRKWNEWMPVKSGDVIDIPPGTPHTFSVAPGGTLYFLSVQSPPIVDEHGEDDYYQIEHVPPPFEQ
ncbi:hypothetical protein [Archangium sp.]|uniref:cupin domain-containing protein n=1 Tax=Archangium sp. TaxID=1872627 RepID=UPI002D42B386|nr:hypothetical protein [Archangium sp.]HYO56139.1 hypothetical protein [Archangium sp.]